MLGFLLSRVQLRQNLTADCAGKRICLCADSKIDMQHNIRFIE